MNGKPVFLHGPKYGNKCRFHFGSVDMLISNLVIFLVLIFLFLCYWRARLSLLVSQRVRVCVCACTVMVFASLHKNPVCHDNYGKFSILPLVIDIFGTCFRTNESIFSHCAVSLTFKSTNSLAFFSAHKHDRTKLSQFISFFMSAIPSSSFFSLKKNSFNEHAQKWRNSAQSFVEQTK